MLKYCIDLMEIKEIPYKHQSMMYSNNNYDTICAK
jgi:hypothetical protein